ncbi:MAG TPA: HAMP domain-containing methyl-accepting chemotaxis protein, partial [Kofleriaceae bacterium]|nr:HAMP domain-containing methyl-accepting chemotaxis protein [Kofleriaceae bacterium]
MSPRKLRFPMFFKFLVGCLTLAGLLIFGGTLVVRNETRLRSRGNYLQKQERRLEGYIERVGRDMTAMLELVASDDELRRALSEPAAPTTSAAPGAGAGAAAAPGAGAAAAPAAAPAGAADSAASHARQIYDALSAKTGLAPDVFALFTQTNRLKFAAPPKVLDEQALPTVAAVEKARGGSVFAHRIQVMGGVPYQVSALPIRGDRDQVLGGILVGVKLQRLFDEFADQSDDQVETQIRPTLIDGTTILASAWPPERRAELAHAMQPDRYVRVTVGDDTRDVLRLKDGDYDLFSDDSFEGYKAGDAGSVGRLVITRSRVTLVDPASKLPWPEILVGIGASIVIALGMGLLITRPIKQFVKQSRDLLEGETDLTQRLVISSHDETSDLAENINQVFARLHQLATGVSSAAFQVGASSAEISAASRTMLSGLKDQTLKIESSTTAVTELSASIQTVAGNAAQATAVAEQSSTAVTSAVARMESIRAAVADAADKMRELGDSSKRIGNIVEVIRQISEQTSMLALNASIEAAHAGEQGRGFAVVADEVSSLARRVGQSAKDIETLIQTVKEQTQAVMASMEVGTREVASGSQLVTGTLTGLGQLISVVKDTAGAVHEQAVVSDEIARNMDSVRQIATEVLSGSEESVVQAERLHELAFELEESIGGFNLDGNKLAAQNPARPPRGGAGNGAARRALPGGARGERAAGAPRPMDEPRGDARGGAVSGAVCRGHRRDRAAARRARRARAAG